MRHIITLIFILLCAAPVAAQTDSIAPPDTLQLGEANVRIKKERYSRKDNPAVELMRKVIAAKQNYQWQALHENTSCERYSKVTFSLNDVDPRILTMGKTPHLPFTREQVEVCNQTGRLIVPLTMNERVTQHITQKSTDSSREILLGERHSGIEDLFDVGNATSAGMQDLFKEVNVMDDDISLLQHQITSPLSRRTALSFYHYHITDTLELDGTRLYEVYFTPANNQDFGFSGRLLVSADTTYRVNHATLSLPRKHGVNWIESLSISQGFDILPTGEQVLTSDDMIVQLMVAQNMQKFMVQRTTQYSKFSSESIPAKMFRKSILHYVDPEATRRPADFWTSHRPDPLTQGEEHIERFKLSILNKKGAKPVVWLLKAFATNSIPLTVHPERPSKVDITPVNSIISSNPVDGVRLKLSARTTANLLPHLFLRGYVAYGFKDKRWKGLGEVTYAFNKRQYQPQEFPVHNLTATYQNDLHAPSDKYLNTDKDNVFTSLKWAKTEHMMYFEQYRLLYEREWYCGVGLMGQVRHEKITPTGELVFKPVGGPEPAKPMTLTFSEATLGFHYRPAATYMYSKQGRHTLNEDAPLYSVTHTMGFKGVLGSEYRYNLTEAEIYHRLKLNSWGKMDIDARGGIQWNRVPFPLLIMPASNLSYIKQKNTFSLINNMEFLNDRYASLMVGWDLNGKLFNRIPFMRKLKWREFIGVNMLWGMLSSKNDPAKLTPGEASPLLAFPEVSYAMNPRRPYVEGVVGIHNILKLLHVEYVHRFTYNDLPTSQRWGLRFRIELAF